MGQRQSYSREFKDAVRVKILNRGKRTIAEVCEEVGVEHKDDRDQKIKLLEREILRKDKALAEARDCLIFLEFILDIR